MTTRRTSRPVDSIGLTKFLGNVVDDTKDFVDDMLNRARDVEHDLRDTAERTFRSEDEKEDLVDLRRQLDQLKEKIERFSKSEQDQPVQPD